MPYILTRYANTTLVPDNGATPIANIVLPGKNYLGYGQPVDQSLLNMVENFAGPSEPSSPIIGQIWFDTTVPTARVMKYNDGTQTTPNWVPFAKAGGNIIADGITANAITTGTIAANNIAGGNIVGTLINKVTFTNTGFGMTSANGNIIYDAAANKTVSWNTVGAAKGDINGNLLGNIGNTTAVGTITGTWTMSAGSTLNATYADLAERHHTDIEYPAGTVMTVGGVNEVTACEVSVTPIGVVSDQYAYLMNAEAGPDETHPAIGYLGRVPVRVIGPITKHQRIAPAGNGLATAADKNSFGWALETNTEAGEKLVLCIIK